MESRGPEAALGAAIILGLALFSFLQPPMVMPDRFAFFFYLFGRGLGLGLTALAGLAFTCALELEDGTTTPLKAVPRYLSGGFLFLGLALALDPQSQALGWPGLALAAASLVAGLILGGRHLGPRVLRSGRRARGLAGLLALAGAGLSEGLARLGPWEPTAPRALACLLVCVGLFLQLSALKAAEGAEPELQ